MSSKPQSDLIGCDSIGGTGASEFRRTRLRKYLRWVPAPAQLRLTP